ncbi:MAG TPA: tyrosine--tRNA ligase [Clostridiales bacterium]|jgi:tyrosyl-tRNA synthetase|nr:tyrosine--tRNA ligase [Clostridiales bacterium]
MHVLDILKERGFIAQITHEEELYKQLEREPTVFYVGFDPTAPSLHFGHFIPMLAMRHMQNAGHIPLALIGGATVQIGDPSGKSELRQMLTMEAIQHNVDNIHSQISKFIDFSDNKALMANNADWLTKLNYLEFIREIGVHFSVNRMIAAECYKQRLERGLTFLEFNYMLMQSYDFLELFRRHNCRLQMGGDDQWSNILAGADLIRRKEREPAFACTFKLLMNSEGNKMGKTERGALWLDPELCSPYEFYQYWRNIADSDVPNCLSMLTFLPMDEVRRLSALTGSAINEAKMALAFEATKMIHGEEEAQKAQQASAALFSGDGRMDDVPTYELTMAQLQEDNRLTTLLFLCGLCSSRSQARKMIEQGAVLAGDNKVEDPEARLNEADFPADGLLLRRGKKNYCRVILKK